MSEWAIIIPLAVGIVNDAGEIVLRPFLLALPLILRGRITTSEVSLIESFRYRRSNRQVLVDGTFSQTSSRNSRKFYPGYLLSRRDIRDITGLVILAVEAGHFE